MFAGSLNSFRDNPRVTHMNRDLILKTAVTYWSDEDECFVVESPFCERIAGIGDTEAEAITSFKNLVNALYADYKDGKLAPLPRKKKGPGRPAKGGEVIHAQIKATTKKQLAELATGLHCSYGEAIDYVIFLASKNTGKVSTTSKMKRTARTL